MPVTETDIALADPATLAARLIEHMVEHEVVFETRGVSTVADLGRGTGTLTVLARALNVRVEAEDAGDLEMIRAVFAQHIVEFAEEPLEIRWTGLGESPDAFANFREIRLISAEDLTPHLRRLRFSGPDLARFASDEDLHVRLYFPPAGLAEPEWPRPGPDGRTLWPADERKPTPRYYTIRRIDLAAGTLDIDFVLHADAGPGSAFAETAQPGARLGMVGPLGRTVRSASWHLLAGCETALPAIARILEGMAPDARGEVFLEVAGPEEEIPLAKPAGVALRWLHRDGALAGSQERLLDAITAASWPEGAEPFIWIGCEFQIAKALRRHFEKERGLPKERQLIVGYWSVDDD
ncbi:siderophore-interacting protein [Methylobacterium brachythecii]|uniref:NADPH-dependent ferric siderophore reductase n=1 Tax=Methylobacterium brachythecii TaxID=1176177 RepID=A0A7W6AL74_9HYPH|nr:siderophore-interacting protein [Methylobacterium brachythecii]MBB3904586.1 NADPH-dependent ferric siderophore reductase [Methylobacterium brachythecii]GLS46350.1 siderophore-interacting protein [Methylobacterium brachythecii]